MIIKDDTRIIKGEHKNHPFKLEKGLLTFKEAEFDMEDFKHLVEIITLLRHEGFELKKRVKYRTKKVDHYMFGNIDVPDYDNPITEENI